MHVFYTPDIQTHAELPEEEAAHAVRVLRLQAGDEVMLTDGKGCFYRAEISTATNKRCLVNILETLPQAPLWKGHLHIAMAPTKNMDRTEWFAEKATEIGFDELTFLNCRFSERKVIKTERISKILVSAIKQSLKARLPQLNEMTDFNKFITQPFPDMKRMAFCTCLYSIPLLKGRMVTSRTLPLFFFTITSTTLPISNCTMEAFCTLSISTCTLYSNKSFHSPPGIRTRTV